MKEDPIRVAEFYLYKLKQKYFEEKREARFCANPSERDMCKADAKYELICDLIEVMKWPHP